ncbi:MAG: thymidylate kinase [Candidatus Eisenbacteria bacterium]|nr:thymidylate kinase [Candidatus Latescibacterota bacterium]MBD3302136.1 thymidylate kinase [Candidatus Eisenbacteria bacterium]
MTDLRFYGDRPPGIDGQSLPGRLIVLEGTDGVGRSTQVALLKEWLERKGYAVIDTGLTRSSLAGSGIQRAKRGHTLDPITLNLFYATDMWDRLERQILPALRAGMVALVDRYIFSMIARAGVRGLSPEWLQGLYEFALIPDRTIYLDIDVEHLLPRVIHDTGFDYWESGRDFLETGSVYQSFVEYQNRLLAEFRRLADRHDFTVIDARGDVGATFEAVSREVEQVISSMVSDAMPPEPTNR